MKRSFAIVLLLFWFTSAASAMALPNALYLDRNGYNHQDRIPGARSSIDLGEYLADSRPPVAQRYLEAKDGNSSFAVGKQSYTLGNGFVAGISGVCGIKTSISDNSGQATFFYGNTGQPMLAGDVKMTQWNKNLSLEASYFKVDNPFVGFTVSGKVSKKGALDLETSENLNTQAKGYVVRLQYGQAGQRGDVFGAFSYRYVEAGAVSDYSADDFDDSKGVRVEATWKIRDDLAFSLLKDFATSVSNADKSRVNASLTWDY